MSSFSTSYSEDKSEYYDQFSTFADLYEYIISLNNESEKCYKLPQYIDQLFKLYNLYTNWDTSKDIDEEVVEILLHLKIELTTLLDSNNINSQSKKLIRDEIDIIDKLSEKFGFTFKQSKLKNETYERTDKNIIPDNKINTLNTSVKIMNLLIKDEQIANEHNDIVFNHPKCYPANKTLKSNNCYGLDRLGIIIRREFFKSKSKPFSWKYIEGTTTPISYFYDPVLNDAENINQILSKQYQLQPSAFTKPSGVIYKIYSHDPELYQRYIDFMNSKSEGIVDKK